ncbi:response regulator transcription factor [Paraburkholderia ultramafica]|nr:response regulator [Paraburkholderia ultramafica]
MSSARLVSIVDDDESARLAAANLVRSMGWQTCTFASAEAYLQSMQGADGGATGCLLSDVRMPVISGVEMFERLLALGIAPPTVFMTAFPTDALRAHVLARGALALLEKPLDVAALAQHLTRVLGTP